MDQSSSKVRVSTYHDAPPLVTIWGLKSHSYYIMSSVETGTLYIVDTAVSLVVESK